MGSSTTPSPATKESTTAMRLNSRDAWLLSCVLGGAQNRALDDGWGVTADELLALQRRASDAYRRLCKREGIPMAADVR